MIHESAPVTNAFVSVPADMGQLNCAAFLAGIIAGVLDSARFVSTLKTTFNIAILLIMFCPSMRVVTRSISTVLLNDDKHSYHTVISLILSLSIRRCYDFCCSMHV